MIEAMACGTPVITSPLGAVPEIVAQGLGFVVDDDRGYLDVIVRIDEIDRDAVRGARAPGVLPLLAWSPPRRPLPFLIGDELDYRDRTRR